MATKKASKSSAKKSAKAAKPTGSQKLQAAGKAGGSSVLQQSIEALDRAKINHDIIIRGIPIPDIIKGTIRARNTRELNTALTAIFGAKNVEFKPGKLFPRGIPVIDVIEVQIDGKLKR